MGKQLKSVDILGQLDKEEPAPKPKRPAPPRKPEMDIQELKAQAETAAIGKPSPYQADLRAKLRDKTQVNFSQIPQFVADAYEDLRKAAGMNKKEYFYHLLRNEGADIPPYEEMDGRKL